MEASELGKFQDDIWKNYLASFLGGVGILVGSFSFSKVVVGKFIIVQIPEDQRATILSAN